MFGRHLRRLVPDPIADADLAVFRRVAGIHSPVLDATLPRLSTAANHSVLWAVIAALLAARGGRFGRRAGLRGLVAIAATSLVANQPGKRLTGRCRPDLEIVPRARRVRRLPTSTSFPSGHSASAAAFATAVGMEMPRLRWPLAALAGAVGFSRIYTGVHYPGDVLAGAALGIGVATATRRSWPLADDAPARGSAVTADGPGPDGAGLVVVVNNQAGPALQADPADQLRHELPAAEIRPVDDPQSLEDVLGDAVTRARVIGIAGGDGSVSTAAAAAQEAGIPLLVVPGGTLNHLASDLGLHSIDDVVAAVRAGEVTRMDLAQIDGRAYVNAASIGVYPHLVDAREELEATIGKWPAVLLGMIRTLRKARPARVTLDGEPLTLWLLFAGNCRYAPTGIAPTQRRVLDDGLLDIRIVHADRPWSRARFLAASVLGRADHSAVFERRLVDQLEVHADDGPPRLACDGEVFDGSADFTITKQAEPLLLLVPGTSG
jgi:diacylglycerol kinase family enzyme/membrane-associated phospholipid phosphatase